MELKGVSRYAIRSLLVPRTDREHPTSLVSHDFTEDNVAPPLYPEPSTGAWLTVHFNRDPVRHVEHAARVCEVSEGSVRRDCNVDGGCKTHIGSVSAFQRCLTPDLWPSRAAISSHVQAL